MSFRSWVSIIAFPLLAGCTGSEKAVERPAVERGEALFSDSDLSDSQFNDLSCATCHSATEPDDRALPGLPLANSAGRSSWWNGYASQYLDAVNHCVVFFMRGQALIPGDPKGDALYEYLLSISPEADSPAIQFTVVKNVQVIPGGDATAGEQVYDRTCRHCHGAKGSGNGRLSSAVTRLDDDLSAYYDERFPGIDHDLVVTEKIRHGQFFGVGGNMPFYSTESLSDEDLADLITYLDL